MKLKFAAAANRRPTPHKNQIALKHPIMTFMVAPILANCSFLICFKWKNGFCGIVTIVWLVRREALEIPSGGRENKLLEFRLHQIRNFYRFYDMNKNLIFRRLAEGNFMSFVTQ